MSTEIVSMLDQIGETTSNIFSRNAQPLDLLNLNRAAKVPNFKVDLIGKNHPMKYFISPEKGHQHVTQSNPSPESLKSLLEEMKDPSVLLLLGCDQLLLPSSPPFPFHNFKTLTSLHLSNFINLISLPENTISEMTQLQTLHLSHLPIQSLPIDFFSDLSNLRSLTIRACSHLHSLPKINQLTQLQCLDLSFLPIQNLQNHFFLYNQKLCWIILRGCSELLALPSMNSLQTLEVLDLSHCTALQEIVFPYFLSRPSLKIVDFSYTALLELPCLDASENLTHLFLSDTKATRFDDIQPTSNLQVLDLSGAQHLRHVDWLKANINLIALDLSRTDIISIDFLSDLIHLRNLILKECTKLVNLPAIERLTNLEVLDISGCEILVDLPNSLSNLTSLKELNLSKVKLNHLPSFSKLTNLQSLNLSNTSVVKLQCISKLVNLKELLLANCELLEVLPDVQALMNLETLDLSLRDDHESLVNDLQVEAEIDAQTGQFLSAPSRLRKLVLANRPGVLKLFPQESLDKLEFLDLRGTNDIDCIGAGSSQGKITKCDEIHLFSTFLQKSSGFDRFRCEHREIEDLVSNIQKNFDVTAHKISYQLYKRHFGSINEDLKYILKHLNLLESSRDCRTSEKLLHKLFDVATHLSAADSPPKLNELFQIVGKLKLLVPRQDDYYEAVKVVEDPNSFDAVILNRYLLLFGKQEEMYEEEFRESYDSLTNTERNCLLCFAILPSSGGMDDFRRNLKRVKIKRRTLIQWWIGEGFIMSEEIGKQIFKALEEKRLIAPMFINSDWKSTSCCMFPSVHSFVTRQATEEGFFGSKRACLLKSQGNLMSSCELWSDSKRLKTIRTLFNVNETMIYIKPDWFSKMMNLHVLHLGSLNFVNAEIRDPTENEECIEVVDWKFMEEFKKMKQLRLLCLKGFLGMTKLPKAVCKLSSLKILDLRDCGYLEDLPDGIGSLKQLTHLDLTNCHTLSKLPKGVMLLSELEVLKGFVISYQTGGRQHRKACTLRELLKLKKLRKLNLVVNAYKFPYKDDLGVFREMTNLRNLKITWEEDYNKDQEQEDEELRQCLSNLKKLVLYCFPLETAPNWLHPRELQSLEKLYLEGGNLKTLPGDTDQYTWSFKTLRLMYLPRFRLDWSRLGDIFSNMTLCYHHKLKLWYNSSYDVWKKED